SKNPPISDDDVSSGDDVSSDEEMSHSNSEPNRSQCREQPAPGPVLFLHPDLGIGGAERAMVDMALALKDRGYPVSFITAHHDKSHCFEETRNGQLDVFVSASWLPRSLMGRCIALCACLRMLWAALYVLIGWRGANFPRAVIVDQVSAPVPLLRWFSRRTLFYCHYPDLLLSTQRSGRLKRMYRRPLDALEAWTTGRADELMVNSRFTASVVRSTFPALASRKLHIVYPVPNFASLDIAAADPSGDEELQACLPEPSARRSLFLSLNRYERKKNVGLALKAFARLLNDQGRGSAASAHLVIAGGYDSRLLENVEHFEELRQLAEELQVSNRVTFLRSCSSPAKAALLKIATALIYTPSGEHFGIVPVEAQYLGCPVVAVNNGGPLETVLHGATGFLCEPGEAEFSAAMGRLVNEEGLRTAMGRAGRRHVTDKFSNAAFADAVVRVLQRDSEASAAASSD
ncbi:hypothetical protein BOX15_Mlig024696g3, partial [Macrostomum lignano]